MRIILLFLGLLLFTSSQELVWAKCLSPKSNFLVKRKQPIRTIILDPGHGGKDPGAHGKFFKEKDITLGIALKLKNAFKVKYPNLKIVLTRSTDEFIPLEDRASFAKRKKGDLFISIHCNANPHKIAKGYELYTIGINSNAENLKIAERENSVILLEKNYKERYEGFDPNSSESYIIFSLIQSYTVHQSLNLAIKINKALGMGYSDNSRGVKQAGFLVLRRNTVPSILLETGFITNPEEEKTLGSALGQEKIVHKILLGFEYYRKSIED